MDQVLMFMLLPSWLMKLQPYKEIPNLNPISLARLVIEKDYLSQFSDHFITKMKDLKSKC